MLQYLKETLDYGITFNEFKGYRLVAYSDINWAADMKNCKSTTGSLIKIAGASIFWCSAKQTGVLLSTIKAEYIAASETAKNVVITRGILTELGVIPEDFAFSMLLDNTGAIVVSGGEKVSKNTRHINIHYHHI